MSIRSTNLFAALAADGNTASFTCPGDANTVRVYLQDGATFGSGTLTMQGSIDGTNWYTESTFSVTAGDGYLGEATIAGRYVRFNLAGSTSPGTFVLQIDVVAKSNVDKFEVDSITDNTVLHEFVMGHKPTVMSVLTKSPTTDYDSGSIKVQQSADGGTTWYDVTAALTADGAKEGLAIGDSSLFRLEIVSVAGASADIDVTVVGA